MRRLFFKKVKLKKKKKNKEKLEKSKKKKKSKKSCTTSFLQGVFLVHYSAERAEQHEWREHGRMERILFSFLFAFQHFCCAKREKKVNIVFQVVVAYV